MPYVMISIDTYESYEYFIPSNRDIFFLSILEYQNTQNSLQYLYFQLDQCLNQINKFHRLE